MTASPARIHLLYTGGTIGMGPREPGNPDSPLVPQDLARLTGYLPALAADARVELSFESFARPLDSSNIGPEHWLEMARAIGRAYASHDGFVVLHGTDTLAYSASALSFLLENLAKPVVFTGSQLPISDPRTDAVQNLANAIQVAGGRAFGLPLVPEVAVVFADKVMRGCRVRKVSTTSWAGFDSPNYPPLGTIGDRIRIDARLLRPVPAGPFHVHTRLDPRVLDIALTPGLRPEHLESILLGEAGIDAIVLRTFGAGNAPDAPEFLDVIERATRSKKMVLSVTQCLEGMVEMGLYAASAGLAERGVISALDLTPEAALTKLMWTLGGHGERDEVARQMQVDQRGEQSFNLFDLRYGGFAEPARRLSGFAAAGPRFHAPALRRAVVRIAGLRWKEADGVSGLRIFVNQPDATGDTPVTDPRCVATVAAPMIPTSGNLAVPLDLARVAEALAGSGSEGIGLTVVPAGGEAEVTCRGVFLALMTSAL